MRRIVIGIAICLWTIAAWPSHAQAQAQRRGLQPQDYYREIGVSQTAISPAGDLVAFTVTTIDEDENTRHREIWMQRLRGSGPDGEPFRFTDPTQESSAPRWSPDGRVLSFQSNRGDDPNSTWFARVTAPGGEAHHIDGVDGAPVWSPDGAWIAYATAPEAEDDGADEADDTDERRGWIAPDAISRTLDAERFDGRVITSMRYKRDGRLVIEPHPSVAEKAQLYLVTASGGEPQQLTTLAFDVEGIVWSPDASRLYFTGDELEDDEYSRDLTTDIYLIDREGGEPRRLTSNPGAEHSVALSADGTFLAYLATPARGEETEIKIVRLKHPRPLQRRRTDADERLALEAGRPDLDARRDGAVPGRNRRQRAPVRGDGAGRPDSAGHERRSPSPEPHDLRRWPGDGLHRHRRGEASRGICRARRRDGRAALDLF